MISKNEDALYLNIILDYLDTDSIEKTARNLSVSQVKVRKVLITEGIWSSRKSVEIKHYLDQGKTTEEIAAILHTTEKAVQQYLPYSRGLYNSDNKSADAIKSAEYRRRIQIARERTIKKSKDISDKEGWTVMYEMPELKEDDKMDPFKSVDMPDIESHCFEQYPGVLCFRELPEGLLDYEKIKCKGEDIVRLHLELICSEDKDDAHQKMLEENPNLMAGEEKTMAEWQRVLTSYGQLQYGKNISRDIAVPGDMPLYALHYVIQQAFGWQNSHLHHFELPEDVFRRITDGKTKNWMDLVGVLLRSPIMDDQDKFWADDYSYGSFKTWLRKKYTGPYLSLNHGEGLIQCKNDINYIKERFDKVLVYYSTDRSGQEYISWISMARDEEDLTLTEHDKAMEIVRKEMKSIYDILVESLFYLFEVSPNQLLERLSIDEVLAFRDKGLNDTFVDVEELRDSFPSYMDEDLRSDIAEILATGQDEPWMQPIVASCTDTLYYNYDYGDNWYIKITGSLGCEDLVREGRITQEEIDEALVTVYSKYKPVCLAADGMPVLDDVGGMDGYIRFLRGINKKKERAYWKKIAAENNLSGEEYLEMIPENWDYDDADTLEWAKGLGWNKRMPGRKNLL